MQANIVKVTPVKRHLFHATTLVFITIKSWVLVPCVLFFLSSSLVQRSNNKYKTNKKYSIHGPK